MAPSAIPDLLARSQGVLLGQMVADALGACVEGWGPEDVRKLALSRGWDDGLLQDYVLAVHMGTYVAGPEPATYEPALRLFAGRYVAAGPPSSEAVARICARLGCYTDDSNCALALASHLVEERGLSAKGAALRYSDFFFDGPRVRGYPDTAKAVLHLVRDGVSVDETGLPPHFPYHGGSFANGAAMRASPLGVAFRNATPSGLAEAARAAVKSSHRHPEATDGALIQAEAVRYLLKSSPETLDTEALVLHLASVCEDAAMRNMLESLASRLREVSKSPPSTETDISELRSLLRSVRRQGSSFDFQIAAVHGCPCALWVFGRYGASSPFEAVQRAIALGGDTDTVASLVGALCGALHGLGWIPEKLLAGLENDGRGRDFALDLAANLAALDLHAEDVKL